VHPERVTEVPASLLPAESRPLKSPVAAPAPAVTAPPATTPAAAEAPQNPDISPAAVSPSSVPSVSASAPSPTPVAAATPPPAASAPPPSPVSAPNPTEALAAPPPSADGQSPRVYGVDDGPSRVVLRATADSWIQIRGDDHAVLFTGLLKPGDTYRVPDRPGLQLRAGNVGGLDVIVDGKPAPSLGPLGAVRNVTLDPQSLMAEGAGRQ
jgi:cytoskeleton protein RodZ